MESISGIDGSRSPSVTRMTTSTLAPLILILLLSAIPARAQESSASATPPSGVSTPLYLVIADAAAPDYTTAGRRLAKHRKGRYSEADLASIDALERLEKRLREEAPEYVAFVIPPERLDTNFVRRILMLSTRIDADPFCDFAWGFITGATGKKALAFVERMIRAECEELSARYLDAFVTTRSLRYPGAGPEWMKSAGYACERMGFGCREERETIRAFVEKNFPRFAGQGLITFTGCGDPERIWLFDDHRNMEREKHWAYAPDRVGDNFGDEMYWIDADRIRTVDWWPAVLLAGPCHSGSLSRVFVEGDIVSTFGRTEKLEVYRMPPEKSLGLAWLASGVTAAVLPVGPNHGWRTVVEKGLLLSTGVPLGEMMRRLHGELALAVDGPIELGLYDPAADRKADQGIRAIMRGGAANRTLFGDPLFRPFPKLAEPALSIEGPFPAKDGIVLIKCTTRVPFDYGDPRTAGWVDQFTDHRSRLLFDLPWTGEGIDGEPKALSLVLPDDAPSPFEKPPKVCWAIERHRGEARLHVMITAAPMPTESPLCKEAGTTWTLRVEKIVTDTIFHAVENGVCHYFSCAPSEGDYSKRDGSKENLSRTQFEYTETTPFGRRSCIT